MRTSVLRSKTGPAARDGIARLENAGASWLQFGNDVFFYGPNAGWSATRGSARGAGTELEEIPGRPPVSRLHLVAQKGRTFQLENPKVPVLFDKGRYLVVDIDPAAAKKLARDEPCFGIRPIGRNETVFNQLEMSSQRGRIQRSAAIDGILNQLKQADFDADLERLTSLTTRISFGDGYRQAVQWASAVLLQLGYAVSLDEVPMPGGRVSLNVIADKTGTGIGTRKKVLVFGHLDSVNSESADINAPAPGADDNGSGSAGVLAIARAMSGQSSPHDLRFILFGGEEQGLFGSRHYTATNAAELPLVNAAINMDMIGSMNTPQPSVLLEGGEVSRSKIEALASSAATYTDLDVQTSLNPFASDHVPFIEADVPAVLTIEGADGANDRIHTARDTIDHIDSKLALEIVRMNTAFVAQELGVAEGAQDSIATPVSGSAVLPVSPSGPAPAGARTTFQFSGRYALGHIGTSVNPARTAPDTIHNLHAPIYLDDVLPELTNRSPENLMRREASDVAISLHIDIDGEAPLDVVSGTILVPGANNGAEGSRSHFIGKLTSRQDGATGPKLVVGEFSTQWPATGELVDRLEIDLSGSAQQVPEARLTFTTVGGRHYGPFKTRHVSRNFRTVEIEVDTETGARNPEPFDTHTHPDRPGDAPRESLTLESTFAKAGIEVVRSPNPNTISSAVAGSDQLWTNLELHDAMEKQWSRFTNQAQFAMWVFLARNHIDSGLGGIMFDADISDIGGVDRQGTAVFTENEFFHSATGNYNLDNPPAAESATREMFFNLIHETGHAFNLAHSFQKNFGAPWDAPSWMPVDQDPRSLSWMNYPDAASQNATGSFTSSAKWFYDRFRFQFDENELLFLRHAPARFVRMGDTAWGVSHGRVSRAEHNHKLHFEARVRKQTFDLGEPVVVELKLANLSDRTVEVCKHLDLCEGFVQLAITGPDGVRRPFVPFAHARSRLQTRSLKSNEAMYEAISLVVGKFGMPFKHPGAYRIEASYKGAGGAAASVCQIYVAPPREHDMLPVVNDLFNARIGRLLTMNGSRHMDEELDKLDHVLKKFPEDSPLSLALRPARIGAFAKNYKTFDAERGSVVLEEKDPDIVMKQLKPVVRNMNDAADAIGHIGFSKVVDEYTACAVDVGKRSAAGKVQKDLVDMFRKRGVVKRVVDRAEEKLKQLS